MGRLQEIRQLAGDEAKKISSSPRDWMGYLDTAARLYRYPFSDTMLIHAQRKDAAACVSLEDWNKKVGRWVKRGARGIALLDDIPANTGGEKIKNHDGDMLRVCAAWHSAWRVGIILWIKKDSDTDFRKKQAAYIFLRYQEGESGMRAGNSR